MHVATLNIVIGNEMMLTEFIAWGGLCQKHLLIMQGPVYNEKLWSGFLYSSCKKITFLKKKKTIIIRKPVYYLCFQLAKNDNLENNRE